MTGTGHFRIEQIYLDSCHDHAALDLLDDKQPDHRIGGWLSRHACSFVMFDTRARWTIIGLAKKRPGGLGLNRAASGDALPNTADNKHLTSVQTIMFPGSNVRRMWRDSPAFGYRLRDAGHSHGGESRTGKTAGYRLCYLDQKGGFRYAREFETNSDGIAVVAGEKARSLGPMEPWRGERQVRRWEALAAPEKASSKPQIGQSLICVTEAAVVEVERSSALPSLRTESI